MTARVPAAAAMPGPAEGAAVPTGEGAEEGKKGAFSALRFGRFLLFLEDMITRQPPRSSSEAGSTCATHREKNFRGRVSEAPPCAAVLRVESCGRGRTSAFKRPVFEEVDEGLISAKEDVVSGRTVV